MVYIKFQPALVSFSWIINQNTSTKWKNLLDFTLRFGQSLHAKLIFMCSTLQDADTYRRGSWQHFLGLREDQAVTLISCSEVLWYNNSRFVFLTCLQMKGAIISAKYYRF